MVYAKPRICPGEWDTNNYGGIDIQILARPLDFILIKSNNSNNNKTWKIVDFADHANPKVKLKENEQKDK